MYWHCEFEIGIAKLNLALRNWIWHCEIGIAKFALRNSHCEFGIAKFSHCEIGLRTAQYPAATVPLVLHPAASHPASTASHFLHFALVFLLIYGLFDG